MDWRKLTALFPLPKGSIRRRLLIWGLLILGVGLTFNTFAGSLYTQRVIKRIAVELQTEIAARVAHEIEEFIRRKVDRLLDLAGPVSLYDWGSERQRLLTLLLLKNDRSFTEIAILNDQGMEVLRVSERRVYLPEELSDQSTSEKFTRAVRGDNYISPVYTSDKAEPYVTVAVPIRVTPQVITGVVTGEANLKVLWDVIGEVEFGRAGYAYLVDIRGNLIAHKDPSLVLKRTNLSHLHEVQKYLRNPMTRDPTPADEAEGITGKRVLSTYAPVRGLGWAVILEEPVDVALAEIEKMNQFALILLGLGLLVGAALIVWVSNRITKPIHELHLGAEVIGRGNLDHRVQIKTGDEIEMLAREFNEMAGELKVLYTTLEDKVEQRTKELSALHDVMTTVNESLDIDPVLQHVIKKITEIFHFDATRIFLFNAHMEELKIRASYSARTDYFAEIRSFRRGQGIVGRVADLGEPIIFEDTHSDPRYQEWSHTKASIEAGFSFFAVFPIKTEARPVGVIVFVGESPRKLAPDEIRLLTSMADQIGVAVEKTSLFEETVTRAKELSALYDVTTTVNESLHLEPVLQEVVKKITEIFEFDTTRLYLFDGQKEELHVRAAFPVEREDLQRVRMFRRGQGIVGTVAETGELMVFEDIANDSRYLELSQSKNTQKTGFRFFAAFPIRTRLNPVGTIICNRRTPRKLTTDEIRLITSMAEQIGVAVEKASLFEQTAARAKELSALNSIATLINESLDIDIILRSVMHRILETFDFDAGRIYLLDRDVGDLRLVAHEGFPEGVEVAARYGPRDGMMGRVLQTGTPIFYEDIQTDPEFQRLALRKTMQRAGYRGQLWIPIRVKGKTEGTLNFVSKKPHPFTPSGVQLVSSIADQIGIAVEKAGLFNETKQKSSELEKANAELVAANRAKEDFLAAMSHELRTPLNVIIGNADLVKDGTFGGVSDQQQKALQKILHYSDDLLKLINNVLAVTKGGVGKLSLELATFEVGDVVGHVQGYVEQLNRDGRLEILWNVEPNLAPMTTDALKLEEILQNLIGNAYKFTLKGKIEIQVRDLKGKARIEFSVADTGIGIANEKLARIFEKFYQLDDAHTGSYNGVGLGLSIVNQYLELMRGDIRVKSKVGKGSTFTFTLPYTV